MLCIIKIIRIIFVKVNITVESGVWNTAQPVIKIQPYLIYFKKPFKKYFLKKYFN